MSYIDLPAVTHPTDRPNFYIISGLGPDGDVSVAYSYTTAIGYRQGFGTWTVRTNAWRQTTGKHLNYLNADKRGRVDYDAFVSGLSALLRPALATI